MPNPLEEKINAIYIQGEIDMMMLKAKIRIQEVEMEYMKEISKIKAFYFNKAIQNGLHESVILSFLL